MDAEGSNEHDERWLSYLMKGKVLEKQKKPVIEALQLYLKALESLIALGATGKPLDYLIFKRHYYFEFLFPAVPKKVNFNSPPDWTLELIEVYNNSINKTKFKN